MPGTSAVQFVIELLPTLEAFSAFIWVDPRATIRSYYFHSLFLGKPSQAVKNRFANASDDKITLLLLLFFAQLALTQAMRRQARINDIYMM